MPREEPRPGPAERAVRRSLEHVPRSLARRVVDPPTSSVNARLRWSSSGVDAHHATTNAAWRSSGAASQLDVFRHLDDAARGFPVGP